jgi:hypothetical protein
VLTLPSPSLAYSQYVISSESTTWMIAMLTLPSPSLAYSQYVISSESTTWMIVMLTIFSFTASS